jgi:hypothetical protein
MNAAIIILIVTFTLICLFNVSLESFKPYNVFTLPASNSPMYEDETKDINLILSNIFNKNNVIESNSFQPYPWYSKFPFTSEFTDVVQNLFHKSLTEFDIQLNKSLEKLEYYNNLEKNTILFKYNVSGKSSKKSFIRTFSIILELKNPSKYFYNDTFLNVFPLSFEDITVRNVQLLSDNLTPYIDPFDPPIGNNQYYKNYYRIKNILGLTTPFYTSKKYMDLPAV